MRNSTETIGNRNRNFSAQCLNQLRYRVPRNNFINNRNTQTKYKIMAPTKGVPKFPKNLGASSKFWAPEGWQKAIVTPITHKHQAAW
jgi:hypothetical protein